ncbi:hypothetical protein FRC15_006730 [Serendipita sp. 397]|nr:hypothetical protein FRC15_006730 [Serendipita sp. 397]KAG8770064.1 hypothetical protein FRC16_006459 [Serendipita sp. 398]
MEPATSLKGLPGLDKIVLGLADDAEKIMVSLYDLQKSLDQPNSPLFSSVRKELRLQWDGLRSYLQRCHTFGGDVLMLKLELGRESKLDLIDFLNDMKISANELRNFSPDLKMKDISEAFSKVIEPGNPGSASSSSFIKGINNPNLKAFVATIGRVHEPKHLFEIDAALERTNSNFRKMCEFWEETYNGCASMIKRFEYPDATILPEDAEQIISDWKRYQEATSKAIASLAKTDSAILVEASSEDKRQKFGLGLFIEAIAKWLRG